jgi:hypothetical protein
VPVPTAPIERSLFAGGNVGGGASVAQRGPSVRWSESAAVDGVGALPGRVRRKVERVSKADAQHDLDELLALRASAELPGPRRRRLATFGEVIDPWVGEGCPTAAPSSRGRHARTKSPNTVANVRYLLDGHVRPKLGNLWVDRTRTERLERVSRRWRRVTPRARSITRGCT